MRLDVESLRTMREVVRQGTFADAAKVLGLTTSAVSWKIKRLEERVGLDLINRGAIHEPTLDGRDLLTFADTIIDTHDAAVHHLQRSEISGAVRLGCNEDVRGGRLTTVLAAFDRMHPGIDLEVRIHLSGIVTEWLEFGEVDIAVLEVLTEDVRPDDVVLATEQLKWAHARDASFDSDTVVPLVTLGPGLNYREHVEEVLNSAGRKWRVAVECPTTSGVQSAVEEGMGISPLNECNLTSEMVEWEGSEVLELSTLSEVVRVRDGASHAVVMLRDALVTALKESV